MTLERGDVLYVPKHWWHFVESEDMSLSVNVWIDAADDPKDRATEALTRVLVTALSGGLAAEVSFERDMAWITCAVCAVIPRQEFSVPGRYCRPGARFSSSATRPSRFYRSRCIKPEIYFSFDIRSLSFH